jgi:glutamate N-acetyltransferase/amino-acid N-acetyltransferase
MTGKSGFDHSRMMAQSAATALNLDKKDILVASTGVIGKPLPIKKIVSALPDLVRGLSKKGGESAAAGILTTDRFNKETAVEFMIGKRKVRIGAIAKGAGMIHPQMALPKHATMLCFVTTDAVITSSALRMALDKTVQKTFNTISIDGDMSTNDMVLILANGMAQNKKIVEKTKEFHEFCRALESLFIYLAKNMILDAEGATKFVEIYVKNAQSRDDAKSIAMSVATSSLFKCALFGGDPNWGRIAAAVGYADAHVDPWKMQIFLGRELVVKNGGRVKKDDRTLSRVFAKKNIKITVDMGLGKFSSSAYTCDLSTGYVKINSAYRT